MSIVIEDPLATYTSPEKHVQHAEYARLVASYHELKAMAMQAHREGNIEQAQGLENAANMVAAQVEARTP